MGMGTTLTDSSKEMPRRLGLVVVVVAVLGVVLTDESSFEYLRGSCILASDKCLGDVTEGEGATLTLTPGTGTDAGMEDWTKSLGFLRPAELARGRGEGRALLVSFMAEEEPERWVIIVSSEAQTTPRE